MPFKLCLTALRFEIFKNGGGPFLCMNKLDKKIFGTLFFSIFGTVTGVGIVVPLLPVYAHGLGATGLYIALIFGAFITSIWVRGLKAISRVWLPATSLAVRS